MRCQHLPCDCSLRNAKRSLDLRPGSCSQLTCSCWQDIPHDLKAASSKQGASLSGQAQGQGGLSDVQPHRKELRPPEDPNKAASKAAQGSQGAGSQQQQQEQPNPLGHYFQGGVRKSAQGPPSQEARGPPESPLKYYFTNQIPEEVKAKLALDAAVRAKGASH